MNDEQMEAIDREAFNAALQEVRNRIGDKLRQVADRDDQQMQLEALRYTAQKIDTMLEQSNGYYDAHKTPYQYIYRLNKLKKRLRDCGISNEQEFFSPLRMYQSLWDHYSGAYQASSRRRWFRRLGITLLSLGIILFSLMIIPGLSAATGWFVFGGLIAVTWGRMLRWLAQDRTNFIINETARKIIDHDTKIERMIALTQVCDQVPPGIIINTDNPSCDFLDYNEFREGEKVYLLRIYRAGDRYVAVSEETYWRILEKPPAQWYIYEGYALRPNRPGDVYCITAEMLKTYEKNLALSPVESSTMVAMNSEVAEEKSSLSEQGLLGRGEQVPILSDSFSTFLQTASSARGSSREMSENSQAEIELAEVSCDTGVAAGIRGKM